MSLDISKKIKASKEIKMKQGSFIGAMAPYGYKVDKIDGKRVLVMDEKARAARQAADNRYRTLRTPQPGGPHPGLTRSAALTIICPIPGPAASRPQRFPGGKIPSPSRPLAAALNSGGARTSRSSRRAATSTAGGW